MKYLKFTQIDADSGISWAIKQPRSGPSMPNIPGLGSNPVIQLSHSPFYFVTKIDEDAINAQLTSEWEAKIAARLEAGLEPFQEGDFIPREFRQPDPVVFETDPDKHFFVLTFEEYANELKDHVMYQVNNEKNTLYEQENNFRSSTFTPYHNTASVAGIYKYEQAKALIADSNATATEVRAEATARGVDVTAMANRIIQNHESFRTKEAKIAGIRGKMQDRLNAYTFDLTDPEASLTEYNSTEVMATVKQNVFENDEMVEKDVDVTVHKYSLALPARFEHE
jgi:hypothetical protein